MDPIVLKTSISRTTIKYHGDSAVKKVRDEMIEQMIRNLSAGSFEDIVIWFEEIDNQSTPYRDTHVLKGIPGGYKILMDHIRALEQTISQHQCERKAIL